MSIDKTAMIKNPLTIIAIFAGIAEISGTVVLPSLADENQAVFMWFVMLFPIYLVGLFFFVLWHKHEVLYAPSDFRDENHFRDFAAPATYRELAGKAIHEQELETAAQDQSQSEFDSNSAPPQATQETQVTQPAAATHDAPSILHEEPDSPPKAINTREIYRRGSHIGDGKGKWLRPDQIALGSVFCAAGMNALQLAFGARVGNDQDNYIFDAIIQRENELVAFESLIISNVRVAKSKMDFLADSIRNVYANMPSSQKDQFVLVLAVVFLPYVSLDQRQEITTYTKTVLADLPIRTHYRKIRFEQAFENSMLMQQKFTIFQDADK